MRRDNLRRIKQSSTAPKARKILGVEREQVRQAMPFHRRDKTCVVGWFSLDARPAPTTNFSQRLLNPFARLRSGGNTALNAKTLPSVSSIVRSESVFPLRAGWQPTRTHKGPGALSSIRVGRPEGSLPREWRSYAWHGRAAKDAQEHWCRLGLSFTAAVVNALPAEVRVGIARAVSKP